MNDIRYVCLSDMHLGEEDSLLTNMKVASSEPDPTEASPVLKALVECIKVLIEKNSGSKKPTLILNGDILELALALTNQAAMAFERFIELLKAPDGSSLFKEIIFIPGNHDHHIWEIARETQYVHYMRTVEPGSSLKPSRHNTSLFLPPEEEFVSSYFLTNLVGRYPHMKDMQIKVVYPNLGLLSEEDDRCVIFHHGHFIESIYKLMSKLRSLLFRSEMPSDIEAIEAENFAWIDFFWSTMGRSGKAGEAIESIYEHMLDLKDFNNLLSDFAGNVAKAYDLPGWGDWMEAKILEKVLHSVSERIFKTERKETRLPLSRDAEKGLWTYVEVPLLTQILTACRGRMPSEVSFIFGHTHKPFQEDLQFSGYPKWVDVYNTGGWVVDTVKREPIHGAAVILADEKLNLTSLRMYNESDDPEKYSVRVAEATHAGQKENPFHKRITGLVQLEESVFKQFSESAERAVYIRAQKLRHRLQKSG